VKHFAIFGLIAGLLAAMALVLGEGVGSVWRSAALIGAGGFLFILAYRACVMVFMGTSWYMLGRHRPDARLWRYVWGRLIRDSAAEALPLSQVGGFVFGARALSLAGVNGAFAAASTVVDVTAELVGQLAYTALGLILLQRLHPGTGYALPLLGGLLVMAACAAGFIAVQARGAGFAEHAASRMAREFFGRNIDLAGGVQAGISDLHRRPAALAACALGHLFCWIISGIETWIALRLTGQAVSIPQALTIDSLLYGLRSIAFAVPNGLGVQEGSMIVLCALFGIAGGPALAVSLLKRARDLTLGIPALLVWQAMEGRRALKRPAVAIASGGQGGFASLDPPPGAGAPGPA
jgi:putative membrane protein